MNTAKRTQEWAVGPVEVKRWDGRARAALAGAQAGREADFRGGPQEGVMEATVLPPGFEMLEDGVCGKEPSAEGKGSPKLREQGSLLIN